MTEAPRTPYPDDIVQSEIQRASLPTANVRIAFRQMKAMERQAVALETIAEAIVKLSPTAPAVSVFD